MKAMGAGREIGGRYGETYIEDGGDGLIGALVQKCAVVVCMISAQQRAADCLRRVDPSKGSEARVMERRERHRLQPRLALHGSQGT